MSFAAPLLGVAGIASNIAGGFMGAAGARQAANAANMSYAYQAQVAANNAMLANEAADRTLASGAAAAQDMSLKGAANVGAIKAGQAASGIDVNTGSAVNVQASARERNQLETQRTMENAQERAWGYRTSAQSDTAQAQLDLMSGKNALAAGETQALSSEVGGLGTGALGAATALNPKWGSNLNGLLGG